MIAQSGDRRAMTITGFGGILDRKCRIGFAKKGETCDGYRPGLKAIATLLLILSGTQGPLLATGTLLRRTSAVDMLLSKL